MGGTEQSMRWVKVLGYLVTAWLVLGCSGLTSVFLRNRLNESVLVHVRTSQVGDSPMQFQSKLLVLPAHSTSQMPICKGYEWAPEVTLTILSKGARDGKTLVAAPVQVSGSGGEIYLDLEEDDLKYMPQRYLDDGWNRMIFTLFLVPFAAILMTIVLVKWRNSRRRALEHW